MKANKCLFCGSNDLRADRALSGRLVCNSCGNPYGVQRLGKSRINNFYNFSFYKKYWLFILILIIAFIIAII